jgi:hypothetical protein
MRRTYVHMCDLRVVMKADRTSDFGVDSPYSRYLAYLPTPLTACHVSACVPKCSPY